MQFFIKIALSGVIIAATSEIAKRVSWVAAILASLPLISILAMIWLYIETKDIEKVISLSNGIFWAVLPSLLFFVVLPILLKMGMNFSLAMGLSMAIMFLGYMSYVFLLNLWGIKL